MIGKRFGFFYGIISLCLLILFCAMPAFAGAETGYTVPGKDYELPDNSDYELSAAKPVSMFSYGGTSMGKLRLTGDISTLTTQDDFNQYGANGPVFIHYTYTGAYQYSDMKKWYVDDDGTGKVNGYGIGGLFKGVGRGCIIVEESLNGVDWLKTGDHKLNYFTGKKNDTETLIYSIPEEEIKNGRYYRVLVAYRFCRKTGDGFMYIGDQHEYIKCIEVYQFYVCSENNYITFCDMGNGALLPDQAAVETGFMIRKNGSQAAVIVNDNGEESHDFDCFVDPGEYDIEVITKLGHKYKHHITVTNGISFTTLQPKVFESEKDKSFPLDKAVNYPVYGSYLTSLSLATPKGAEVKEDAFRYGITGKNVSFYLKLNQGPDGLGSGWTLTADKWGERKNQLVYGIETGEIGKGALIIQTSTDGKNWTREDMGRYDNGLYTTDYVSHYGKAENVLIYTPSGESVINGIYIRFLFAYQVNNAESKEYLDYVEVYEIYLCSNELNAVTFHNLSIADTLDETFADADQNTVDVYKQAETLIDGSYTATGFYIDKSLNPTVKHSVLRNGESVDADKDVYDETGKYDITLTSAVGSTRTLTIYVDRLTPEEAMKQYFSEGYIMGKRIFSEGEYPVYEGGETTYHITELDKNVLPLYGQITNISTGTMTIIDQNSEGKTDIISEPGDYQAVFATSEKVFTGDLAGDARVFTFRYSIIPQGSAPGPVVNQKLLDDYKRSTVTDCNPVYYGLTYSSAEKGKITLAFATREAAVNYAYEYEKGMVELQEDGGYRYNGSFIVDQNMKYDSTWDLTDAVYYFADAAVHKHYFNMSDEFTYLSMSQETLDAVPNLRQLELPRSVTIFTEGQKAKLTDIDALPLLNDKPYAYLNPATGEVDRGFYSFEFITDQYGGIDSKSVTITDSEGVRHEIRYSESVGQQLLADHCPSGIVTVREETMYGDVAEYKAVYIAPGENQTELTLAYKQDEDEKTIEFKGSGTDTGINADSFRIVGLADPLDSYAFVIVKHNQNEYVYTAKDEINAIWSDPGEYKLTCVNRMGYGYSVMMTLNGTDEISGEQNGPKITAEPVVTPEPADTNAGTVKTPQPLPAETDKDLNKPTIAPVEKTNEPDKKGTGGNNATAVIIILAGLILVAVLAFFASRRVKFYRRMTDAIKSEEKDKHE